MNTEAYSKIRKYIDHNPIATLGTINPDGTPHGAVVYVTADDHKPVIYFVTKQQTVKLQNLRSRSQVSLTIVNPSESSTLQANGHAVDIQDAVTIDAVMKSIARKHTAAKHWLPPVVQLRAGAYEVVGVQVSTARLTHFENEPKVVEYTAEGDQE